MPYVISFVKAVQIPDAEQYINDCCIGGDVVLDRLLPALRERYGRSLVANQEDWGWFAWFEQSGVKLAVDVHTNDPKLWEFQLHLTSRKPRFLFGAKVEDTPELEELNGLVIAQLKAWPVERLAVERANEKYLPI
jgi:hypothetical protein